MTVEQIVNAIGCTEQQASEFLAHAAASVAEVGTWTTAQHTAEHCLACGRRTWHDADGCISCRPQPVRKARRSRKGR